ncbi:hypothetical protein J1N35_033156 [Gossypium stocksii]|uniref:RNase H type-1 domain-containing protein n=1 Tax=Gossypium stocksii TaxID=47602 RepID=A0A9D3UPV7_9ROSI|nr:hypothetical protein J1N35_033156 [Gossypium stocksii]
MEGNNKKERTFKNGEEEEEARKGRKKEETERTTTTKTVGMDPMANLVINETVTQENLLNRWCHSRLWWVKVNTSGFLSSCGNKASIGGVIRDCGGDWVVGFTMDVSATPIFQVEAKALYQGMRFAWNRWFRRVELESDNGLLVEVLRNYYGERNEL